MMSFMNGPLLYELAYIIAKSYQISFFGGIHVICMDMEGGRGFSQMFILLILENGPQRGTGSKMSKKNCQHGLWMTPFHTEKYMYISMEGSVEV